MQIIKTPLNQVNPQSQAELISYVDPSLTDALNPALILYREALILTLI